LKHTNYPYRLIVIDNASDRPAKEYLENLKKLKGLDMLLIRNNENLGFVKAVNQGISSSGAPYICIMNNDTIATESWLKELVRVMESDDRIGLLNPSSNTSGQYPAPGQSIDDYAATLNHFKGEIQELYTCRGFCMLLRREVVNRLGPLDEIYHMGYFDDTDYCKKAQGALYRTARAKGAYVYHKENISFKSLKDNKKLFEDNEKIFFKRWGRPVRVGYFIDRIDSVTKIDRIATDVARSGHQILIFLKRGLDWPVRLDHFDIRKIDLDPVFFGLVSTYKIFKRRKKKKLDILVTDNRPLGFFFETIKALHGSDVLIDPGPEALLGLLKAKSKIS
jgi:GT2 family glycosyltransferase